MPCRSSGAFLPGKQGPTNETLSAGVCDSERSGLSQVLKLFLDSRENGSRCNIGLQGFTELIASVFSEKFTLQACFNQYGLVRIIGSFFKCSELHVNKVRVFMSSYLTQWWFREDSGRDLVRFYSLPLTEVTSPITSSSSHTFLLTASGRKNGLSTTNVDRYVYPSASFLDVAGGSCSSDCLCSKNDRTCVYGSNSRSCVLSESGC